MQSGNAVLAQPFYFTAFILFFQTLYVIEYSIGGHAKETKHNHHQMRAWPHNMDTSWHMPTRHWSSLDQPLFVSPLCLKGQDLESNLIIINEDGWLSISTMRLCRKNPLPIRLTYRWTQLLFLLPCLTLLLWPPWSICVYIIYVYVIYDDHYCQVRTNPRVFLFTPIYIFGGVSDLWIPT